MRKSLSLLLSFLIGVGSTAKARPTMDEISAFHSLVQTGGVTTVETALKNDSSLATAADQFQFQAIHMLDYADFSEKLALLVRYGADVNAQNDEGHSLLHILIDAEFLPVVLDAGSDLELRDKRGRTPLMLALTEAENYDMIAGLLEAGADPNTHDNRGQTALSYARMYSDETIVGTLLQAGATQ